MTTRWPDILVQAVRRAKSCFAFFSDRQVAGIPLDWPLRFVLLAALYLGLRRWLSARPAAALCLAILLAKELFDIVARQRLWPVHPPDAGDLADILSGLLGLAAGVLIRLRRGGPAAPPSSSTS